MFQTIPLASFLQRVAAKVNNVPELTGVWVVAELCDFRMSGPHAYGRLLEKDASGRTIAKVDANIWSNQLAYINDKFFRATGQRIPTGIKLSLCISAGYHPSYGLSVNIRDIDPAYTLGDMERLRREILDRLRKEGIYDQNRSEFLTPAPQKIAIISAEGAAGYGDFMQQLHASGYQFYTALFPASLQGERTVSSILQALDRIEASVDFWDCVVIIRGGGSTTDLNSFDNYDLAARVATFPLPIVVGIGHERDNTVLDYIAHTRCKTPTAVAAFLIDSLAKAEENIELLTRRIADFTRLALAAEKERLARVETALPTLPVAILQRENQRLERLQNLLMQLGREKTIAAERYLANLARTLATSASASIAKASARLDGIPALLRGAADAALQQQKLRLDGINAMVEVLSPEATLKRGYSITRIGGRAIKSIHEVKAGEILTTILPDGSIHSRAED